MLKYTFYDAYWDYQEEKISGAESGLEKSMELFQEGMKLSQYCRKEISTAEQKVRKVIEDATGEISVEDIENE